ncbi:MAG: TetR/AcrR family transcriptional regulator [Janthinobacterium lividum]
MPATKKKPAPAALPVKRGVGRPSKNASGADYPSISHEVIVARAAELALGESLSEITVARMAREFHVTSALIHYYIGNRDDLLSAIINAAYKERMERTPPLTGDWRHDLETLAKVAYANLTRWRGVTMYFSSHSAFRLFQKVPEGGQDYGVAYTNLGGNVLREAGFSAADASMAFYLVMLHALNTASWEAHGHSPSEVGESFVAQLNNLPARGNAGIKFLGRYMVKQSPAEVFECGLELLLEGIAGWRHTPRSPARKTAARRKAPSVEGTRRSAGASHESRRNSPATPRKRVARQTNSA